MMDKLKAFISQYESAAIAFSGGSDSAFLLAAARDVLGDRAVPITARVASLTDRDYRSNQEIISLLGIHNAIELEIDQFQIPEFVSNDKRRCYYCKRALFTQLVSVVKEHNLSVLFDGTNADDGKFYRPGHLALSELGIVSPLKECGISKKDVRFLSDSVYNLPSYNKPSDSCLATRFPYNTVLTKEKLQRVGLMENLVISILGDNSPVRCADHSDILRIDVSGDKIETIVAAKDKIVEMARNLGFLYVTLDLEGFSSGKMDRN